jgi:TonB family protein
MSTPAAYVIRPQARAPRAVASTRRPWIRGAFRPNPQATSKRGLVASLLIHIAAGALAVSGALDGLGAMDVLSRTAAFSAVVVELPRVAPPEPVMQAPAAPDVAAAAPAPAPKPASVPSPAKPKVASTPKPERVAEAAPVSPPAAVEPQSVAPTAPTVDGAKARAEVTEALGDIASSLDGVLSGITADAKNAEGRVAARGASAGGSRAQSGDVRGARSANELGGTAGASVAGRGASSSAAPLASSLVAVGAITGPSGGSGVADGSGGGGDGSTHAASGDAIALAADARSNASLLAVIRRYAAGVQYCYENELTAHPGLGGRLVVSLTVAASGAVTEARVVQNTVGSSRLESCVIAQVRTWRFPSIREGVVTFNTPFLFTPPS